MLFSEQQLQSFAVIVQKTADVINKDSKKSFPHAPKFRFFKGQLWHSLKDDDGRRASFQMAVHIIFAFVVFEDRLAYFAHERVFSLSIISKHIYTLEALSATFVALFDDKLISARRLCCSRKNT